MREAKNAVPPYTWSGTRPGIIITANLLPSMLGAGMHGNVMGGGLLVHRVDPGPGSMCSSPEKPSRTRAGGRGGRRGNPALP